MGPDRFTCPWLWERRFPLGSHGRRIILELLRHEGAWRKNGISGREADFRSLRAKMNWILLTASMIYGQW